MKLEKFLSELIEHNTDNKITSYVQKNGYMNFRSVETGRFVSKSDYYFAFISSLKSESKISSICRECGSVLPNIRGQCHKCGWTEIA